MKTLFGLGEQIPWQINPQLNLEHYLILEDESKSLEFYSTDNNPTDIEFIYPNKKCLIAQHKKHFHVQVVSSSWSHLWLVYRNVDVDSSVQHLFFGSAPPISILWAFEFFCFGTEDFPKTSLDTYFETVSSIKKTAKTKLFPSHPVKKVYLNGKALLSEDGSFYLSSLVFSTLASETCEAHKYELVSSTVKEAACTEKCIVVLKDSGFLYEFRFEDFPTSSRKNKPSELLSPGLWSRLIPHQELELSSKALESEAVSGAWNLQFKTLVSGGSHFLALSQDNALYSWGSSRYGETGHGDLTSRNEPTLVEALAGIPISDIACGGDYSVVLSACGDVYSFGSNRYGQLGRSCELDNENISYGIPSLIDFPDINEVPDIVKIKCGYKHTVIIDEFGNVWQAGLGGLVQQRSSSDSPKLQSLLQKKFNILYNAKDCTSRCQFIEASWNITLLGF